jgi:pimeloyl-ACP methyl ester carboxylesterase
MLRSVTAMAACVLAGALYAHEANAQIATPVAARNVVLVHGAWADGSSWSEVITLLQAAGLHVTSVQNTLTSLADAAAETRRALALQDGPTVLVGHSWSGTLVSEVGTDPKVSALVYVAARAPDVGEDFVALSGKFPTMPVRAGIETHDGFTKISEDAFLKYFANGVPHEQAKVLYAEQEPTAAALFGDRTTAAAWHSKPSFYAVSKQDMTISPDLERFLAARMKATTVELDAGHLSLVSHPREIADLILAAAGRKNQTKTIDQEKSIELRGTGVQVYRCEASSSGFGWRLDAPEATLLDAAGAEFGRHFTGPTWQARDGSTVVGEVVASNPAPQPGSIPWLLLRAKSHSGSGAFASVGYIARIQTEGGLAPANGCDATDTGTQRRVPYGASYVFFSS